MSWIKQNGGNSFSKHCGHCFANSNLESIESFDEAVLNATAFSALEDEWDESIASKRFNQFCHWYYFPNLDKFAPSKFLGYKNTSIETYDGGGSGTETNRILSRWFVKVDRNSKEFKMLRAKLMKYADRMGKKVAPRTFEGTGAIYTPSPALAPKLPRETSGRYDSEIEFHTLVQQSLQRSEAERLERLENAPRQLGWTVCSVHRILRNPDVVAQVLFRANGICELCEQPAPFSRSSDGTPYLEVHHRIRLADKGDDTVENAVAVCPNCHRRMHYG